MDTPRYRIGNDLSVFWAIHNRDGSPFDMEGMDVRLFVTNDRGRKEVDVFLATLPDGTINNVIRWDFKGEDQRVLGLHTLTVEISDSATHREIIRDYCQAFELVGRSELETEEGDANISIGGDLILSSKLDIYRFEATNVDLSGIKESIHDLNETIKDINEEAIEIKVTINGIQSQVNDIGTELTNKASVETVVEIGEQITEVQTNVAEQTIKVNSLGAEIATKASAESVTQIADELAITNESLAEQVVKVTDLTAEVSTKASSEMVTEISDNLKITNDTLAEQTLKVEALSAEISTKASAESVADIAGELAITNKSVAEQTIKVSALESEIATKASTESVTKIGNDLTLVNETVAEQTIKVSDLESEIATKASSESVLTLEGDVTAVEKAVAEQTIKVEGLEASIESKVSKEEFNEKTGELDTKYTNLKQTADNLTIEVGEQGESLTKVVADVNGLSVRVDDIGEAQANYDNTLSELTDILSPEEMSTQIGKGVVLSTVIATRDTDGDITAGMNASSVHSDPVHGRVVFAGGVKNKTDWTKATGIIYEDGHIVMNSGEFGENVKIGNAMFRAVLEGDFDLFSYPENGTLVPLFQVNKDSSGKIVSISTPYDFTVNRNLVVFGDTSSGGEGGSSSVGIQGITLNGTTYRDDNSDGIIDLGTITSGLTSVNWSDVQGRPTALSQFNNDLGLGTLAYKNGLTASDIPDLSGSYLSTAGGTISGISGNYTPLIVKTTSLSEVWIAFEDAVGLTHIGSARGVPSINSGSGNKTILHSGNYSSYALPLSGGTLTGALTISDKSTAQNPFLWFSINNSVEAGIGYYADYGTYLYNGTSGKILGIFNNGIPHFHFQPLLHSGNYSDYALPLSGGKITGDITTKSFASGTDGLGLYIEGKSNVGIRIQYNKSQTGKDYDTLLLKNGVISWNDNTLLHSGNVGDYKAGSANILASSYQENINYAAYTTHLKLIKSVSGDYATNGFPVQYVSGLSVMSGYTGWQMVTYGDPASDMRPYFRAVGGGGDWQAWKQLAFTDSNVASATKLATARTIWGQSFDGTGDVSGNLNLGTGVIISSTSGTDRLLIDFGSAGDPYFGYGTAGAGISSNICGNNIYLRYGTSRTAGLILNESGNVGVGTTDPYCLFEVASSFKDINPTNIAASAIFAVNRHKDDGLFIGHDYTKKGSWIQSAYYGTEANPSNAHTYRLFLNPIGGNVLIGTTTDSGAKLGIEGSMVNLLSLKRTAKGAGAFIDYHANNDSANQWRVGHDYGSSGSSFKFIKFNGTSEQTLMTINSSGNVGIGTLDPAYKLDVAGNIYASANVISNGYFCMTDSQGSVNTAIDKSGDTIIFGYGFGIKGYDTHYTGYNVHIEAGGGWKTGKNISLLHNGNVGIGTTSPAYKLDVIGDFCVNRNDHWSNNTTLRISASDNNVYFYADDADDATCNLRFVVNGTQILRLASGGDTSLTGSLSVSGAVTMASTLNVAASITSEKLLTTGEYGIWRGDAFTTQRTANDLVYYAVTHDIRGAVTMSSTLNVTGALTSSTGVLSKDYFKVTGTGASISGLYTNARISGENYPKKLWLYNDAEVAIYGSEIQLRNNTTINGNLVVTGDISA